MVVCMLDASATHESFWNPILRLSRVLCALPKLNYQFKMVIVTNIICSLLELNYPFNMVFVTNIIYFYKLSVHFSKRFEVDV